MQSKGLLLAAFAALLCIGSAAHAQYYTATAITNDLATHNISATGTILTGGAGLDDSEEVVNFPAGFSFIFYGALYSAVTVNSNGWVYFGPSQGLTAVQMRTPPTTAPDVAVPNNYIAGNYDDLNPPSATGGKVKVQLLSSPSRFVIMYDQVHHFSAGPASTHFSIVLFATGVIEIHYGAGQTILTGTATGVENSTGSEAAPRPGGLTVTPVPTDAFRWTPAASSGLYVTNFAVGAPSAAPGAPDVVVGAFNTVAFGAAQTTASASINKLGTVSDADISAVKLWADVDVSGTLNAGDVQVGTTQTFSTGSATFSSLGLNLPANTVARVLVTFSFAPTLVGGATFGVGVPAAASINVTPGPAVGAFPVQGAIHVAGFVSQFPYVQTFETFTLDLSNPIPLSDGWVNRTDDGVNDWCVDSAGTSSTGTGPAVDHTLGTSAGKYLYVEDSNTPNGGQGVVMDSPLIIIPATAGAPVCSFWVHAHDSGGVGVTNNFLHVDVVNAATSAVTADVIPAIGHIADASLTVWTQFQFSLTPFIGMNIIVRFRVQDVGTSFTHDIAIDDFEIRDPQEIEVVRNTVIITDGGADAIGLVSTAGQQFSYEIHNLGGQTLNVTLPVGITPVSGTPGASVAVPPAATVAPGTMTTLTIDVAPGVGPFSFTVSIANDDSDENPYDFTVSGTGFDPNLPATAGLAAGSTFTGTTNGPFSLALNPAANLVAAEIELTDAESDNITVTTITPPATVPTGIVPPAVPAPGQPILLAWTGVADASNQPGNYTWVVTFQDAVNGTPVVVDVTITINDVAPAHIAVAGITGNGSAGTPYLTTYTEGLGGTVSVNLADVNDGNLSQVVAISGVNDVSATGGSGFQFVLTANVLSVSPAGTLVANDVGTQIWEVTVTDGTNPVLITVTISVNPEISFTSSPTLMAAQLNGTYPGATITWTGGTGAVTLALTSGALPANLTLSTTGTVSGTTTAAVGTYNFTVTATDSLGASTDQVCSIDVIDPPAGLPVITNGSVLPAGTLNLGYTLNLTVAGGTAPYTFSLDTGTLPTGLTLSASGVISGTPGAVGSSTFAVRVQDSSSRGVFNSSSFTLSIVAPKKEEDSGSCAAGFGFGAGAPALLAVLGLAGLVRRRRKS